MPKINATKNKAKLVLTAVSVIDKLVNFTSQILQWNVLLMEKTKLILFTTDQIYGQFSGDLSCDGGQCIMGTQHGRHTWQPSWILCFNLYVGVKTLTRNNRNVQSGPHIKCLMSSCRC